MYKRQAVFVPFTTQELFQGGEALYYGLNALSNNMIMVDRKQLKNPNGLILGTPGSGKSFSAKREMANAFLITEDDIIVCDPEAEYFPLVQKLGGQVIRISPVSTDYINPLDINTNYSEAVSYTHLPMPRMSKKRRLEWSFFLRQVKVGNTTCDRITYNDLCRGCTHSCKQSFRAIIILCPHYYSKRRKKEDRDNGR